MNDYGDGALEQVIRIPAVDSLSNHCCSFCSEQWTYTPRNAGRDYTPFGTYGFLL